MDFAVIPVSRHEVNCSVVWCERTMRAAVIDPGGDVSEIVNFLELMELQPAVVLATHGHFDHAGGIAQFAELTGARIEGPHRGDAGVMAPAYRPARWLEHGDQVEFGDAVLHVLHCPGHCRGHVAYFSPVLRQAFVGDILFRGSIGAWEHAQGNLPELITSIRETLFPLGDDVQFVPGHGASSSFGRERRDNPFVGDAAYAHWQAREAGRNILSRSAGKGEGIS